MALRQTPLPSPLETPEMPLPRVSLPNRLANRRGRLATIVMPCVTEGTPLGFTATAILDALAAGFVSGTDHLPEGVAAFRVKPPPRLNRH